MSLLYAVAGLCLLVIVGLVTDGGGALNAAARANSLALEAARAGGQHLDPDRAIEGTAAVADPQAAAAAARSYLTQAGVEGEVTLSDNGTTLTVTVHDTYQTAFASLLGYSTISVTGYGTAHLIHRVGG